MIQKQLTEKFYTAFSKGDYQGMAECYHENVVFHDPAFGRLEGQGRRKCGRCSYPKKKQTLK